MKLDPTIIWPSLSVSDASTPNNKNQNNNNQNHTHNYSNLNNNINNRQQSNNKDSKDNLQSESSSGEVMELVDVKMDFVEREVTSISIHVYIKKVDKTTAKLEFSKNKAILHFSTGYVAGVASVIGYRAGALCVMLGRGTRDTLAL